MADSFVNRDLARSYEFDVTDTAQYSEDNTYTVSSGDVVNVGTLTLVAHGDQDADGKFVGFFGAPTMIYNLVVHGRGDGTNTAVAIGDKLYVDAADDQLNKDSANGTLFGIALGAVTSGQNATVAVLKTV